MSDERDRTPHEVAHERARAYSPCADLTDSMIAYNVPPPTDVFDTLASFVDLGELPPTSAANWILRKPTNERERFLLHCAIVACRVHERQLSKLRARLAELRRKTT